MFSALAVRFFHDPSDRLFESLPEKGSDVEFGGWLYASGPNCSGFGFQGPQTLNPRP